MKVVELDVLRDSLVGVPGQSGLSVEARKRLSIAVEQAGGTCAQLAKRQHQVVSLVRPATLAGMLTNSALSSLQVANPSVIFMDEPTSGGCMSSSHPAQSYWTRVMLHAPVCAMPCGLCGDTLSLPGLQDWTRAQL
jgi:hypothetical protein